MIFLELADTWISRKTSLRDFKSVQDRMWIETTSEIAVNNNRDTGYREQRFVPVVGVKEVNERINGISGKGFS